MPKKTSNWRLIFLHNSKVAMLIAKHSKPLTKGEFIKDCVMTMVERICPEKKPEFANICLVRKTVARRIEETSSDIKRVLFFLVNLR